ncbi:MAG: GGDEF domain-containing response regulator [Pseudomonadota bacterium]
MTAIEPCPPHTARRQPRDQIGLPVLLVEDQRALAMLLHRMLQDRWGCTVHICASLAEVRASLAEGHPYLVALCDLNLPDAEHGEVIDVVSQAGLPVIAMTAAFGDELREAILKKGVVDYVLKESINAFAYVCELVGRLAKNRGIKVLAVDDSPSIRALLKHALEMYGLDVLVARDGSEGLALLHQHPDLRVMLVDYHMPVMDGFSLTTEARKLRGKDSLAIIGISGNEDPMCSARFLKNGANDFIHKPFHFEEVICRVNQNLEMLELIETNRQAAHVDFLTGLRNRRHFFHAGRDRFEQARQAGMPVQVAMLDIDHFKQVNDQFGHEGGDQVLKAIARGLEEGFADQWPARLGGEEFAILFTGIAPETTRDRLEQLRQRIAGLAVETTAGPARVTLSIGLAQEATGPLDDWVRCADTALYQAKQAGRDRLVLAA